MRFDVKIFFHFLFMDHFKLLVFVNTRLILKCRASKTRNGYFLSILADMSENEPALNSPLSCRRMSLPLGCP